MAEVTTLGGVAAHKVHILTEAKDATLCGRKPGPYKWEHDLQDLRHFCVPCTRRHNATKETT